MKVAVVRFPGSNRDLDAARTARAAGHDCEIIWHRSADLMGAATFSNGAVWSRRASTPGTRSRSFRVAVAVVAQDASAPQLRTRMAHQPMQ